MQQQQPARHLFYALLLIFFLCARALESLKIMDFSLLVGIHNIDQAVAGSGAATAVPPSAVLCPTANLLPLCQSPGEPEDYSLLVGIHNIDQAVAGGGGEWCSNSSPPVSCSMPYC